MKKGNTNFFDGRAAVADNGFVHIGEGFSVRRQEGADILWQAGMVPRQRLRKSRDAGFLECRVGVDPTPLTAFFTQNTLIRAADSLSFGASVVG